MQSTKIKDVLKTKKFWLELFIMTFAMGGGALGIHFILVPSKMIIGSISGLSIVIFKLTGIQVSIVAFSINAFLLILAYILIGKEFGLKTVYTALILSPWLYLLETYFPVSQSLMQDPWLDLICFVSLMSFTQAILFKINASTGGLDILAKIANKYLHVSIGVGVTIAGATICCTAFAINDFRLVLLGLLGTWVNGLVLNHFTSGLNSKKRVCVISRDSDKIKDFVINDLKRGVTLYEVKGGFSDENFMELTAILTKDEFAKLMKFIETNEIKIFMTAGNVEEIYGSWNQKRRGRFLLPN